MAYPSTLAVQAARPDVCEITPVMVARKMACVYPAAVKMGHVPDPVSLLIMPCVVMVYPDGHFIPDN